MPLQPRQTVFELQPHRQLHMLIPSFTDLDLPRGIPSVMPEPSTHIGTIGTIPFFSLQSYYPNCLRTILSTLFLLVGFSVTNPTWIYIGTILDHSELLMISEIHRI
jgi:hypothetical protein